jgi:hypothetical protein
LKQKLCKEIEKFINYFSFFQIGGKIMRKNYIIIVLAFVITSSTIINIGIMLPTTRAVVDQYKPQISAASANPQTIGFGTNITITSTVTDNQSGVQHVNVNITYPNTTHVNCTLTHKEGTIYEYTFTDTWRHGWYNYTIWATDNTSNINHSTTHSFNVTAYATVSIATLQDNYTANQTINLTDPPNPTENLTLTVRGPTWNTYYNASTGENILEVYQGPVNYQEDNGTWIPINNSLSQLSGNHPAYVYGYRTGNDHGLYGVYFKSNTMNDWPVAFTYNRSVDPTIDVVRTKLVGVGYVDPQSNWAYQYLQNVQSSQGQTSNTSITYPGVFTGTDVTWRYGNTGLKEEITMNNVTKTVLQNHPPSQYGLNDASSYLVFITKLDYQNLYLYNNSGLLEGNVTISNAGVEFRDALGQFKCALPLGDAYERNNESVRQKLTYRIIHYNGNTFLLSGLKLSDVIGMVFPVVVDPTLTIYTSSNDGYIYTSNPNYYTGRNASTGTVASSASTLYIGQRKFGSTYFQYRGFVLFNTTALPSNSYVDTAVVSLYKNSDYSTTDFSLTIQNGQPTYLHNPLQSTDYNKNDYSGNGGSFNTSGFGTGYNSINLNSDGRGWLNKTGWTKLCLRSNKDINGTAPSGNEFVIVYANEQGSGYQPKLVITYRNQSKIKNTGTTTIKGYLHIQIQYYNQSTWYVANDVINEDSPRTITVGNQLALDTIFNGLLNTTDIPCMNGLYRVYATLEDPEGNPLICNDNQVLVGTHQFYLCRPCHGWRKLLLQDGFWTGHIYGYNLQGEALTTSNVATRGMANYTGELYVGTENLNKSKWIKQIFNGFAEGTYITMADDSYQHIEDIQSGDTVKAYNMDTHEYLNAMVQIIYQHTSEESSGYTLKINDDLYSSPTQVFLVNGVLKETRDIVTGDNLTDEQGKNITVTSIENITTFGDSTYNFMIAVSPYDELLLPNNLTFFANGIEAYPWSTDGTDAWSYEPEAGIDLAMYIPTGGPELVFKTRANASDGCEIWKYNQSQVAWIPVINGTGTTNTSSGFGDMTNWGAGEIKEFHGYLFVGTWNSPEYGCQIWRYNKTTSKWTNVVGPHHPAAYNHDYNNGGFNNTHNCCVTSMLEFKNHLYVGTMNWDSSSNGFCQVWRTKNWNGSEWEQVVNKGFKYLNGTGPSAGNTTQNAYAWRMANYSGMLYIGTLNNLNHLVLPQTGDRGCELFRSGSGDEGDWHRLILPNGNDGRGFGEKENYGIRGLIPWNQSGTNYLYVGVAASFLQLPHPLQPDYVYNGTEIWRFDNSSTNATIPTPWQCIVGNYTTQNKSSFTYDGFGDTYNKYPWSMAICGNKLWIGTLNAQLKVMNNSKGCEIWNYNGSTVKPSVTNRSEDAEMYSGFGHSYHVAARSMIEFPAGSGQLVVGVVSLRSQFIKSIKEYGCEVWRWYP